MILLMEEILDHLKSLKCQSLQQCGAPTRRGPLVISWVISWAKYEYKFHKLSLWDLEVQLCSEGGPPFRWCKILSINSFGRVYRWEEFLSCSYSWRLPWLSNSTYHPHKEHGKLHCSTARISKWTYKAREVPNIPRP